MIIGLNHLTLSVSDLDRSFRFYVEVLGCRPAARWDHGAYLSAGGAWLCLSLDAQVSSSIRSDYTHFAFSVEPAAFDTARQRLTDAGATVWKENRSEGESLYFLDPDGHKFELHVGDLATRLAACRRQPYEGMVFFD